MSEQQESLGTRRRRFLKLSFAGLATLGVNLACSILGEGQKEDLAAPEGGFLPLAEGANIYLSLNGEIKPVTIRYQKNIDPLVVRPDRVQTSVQNNVYQYTPEPMHNGQTTRRRTGEILGTSIVRLRPTDGIPERGIAIYDTAGIAAQPTNQTVDRIEPGQTIDALQVITHYNEVMWQDPTSQYEINGFQTAAIRQPEKFTNGWAVGILTNELNNPNAIFTIKGYVPNNKVLISA